MKKTVRLSLALNSEKPKFTPAAGACCICHRAIQVGALAS